MNGAIFTAWLEQGLAPTLSEGDTFIMDELLRLHTSPKPSTVFAKPR